MTSLDGDKLTSFHAVLNNRDYTGSRIDLEGERKGTPTASALASASNITPQPCYGDDTELEGLQGSADATIRCVNQCSRQLDILDAGMSFGVSTCPEKALSNEIAI
jgi:hypothetical protein